MRTTSHGPSELSVERLLDDAAWLRALALSLVRDVHAADDLVQETWLRALDRPPARADSHEGWMATVLRNLARDRARRTSRRAVRETAVASRGHAPGAAELVARADAHRALLDEVVRLPEPFREAVLLRFFESLSPQEIAARTGVPAATARSRVHRGLTQLRVALLRRDPDGWSVALLAGVGDRPAPQSASCTSPGGALAMSTKTKTLAAMLFALLLLSAGATWIAGAAGGGAEGQPAAPATAPVVADALARRRVTTAPPLATGSAPAADPVADTAAPISGSGAPARRILAAVVVSRRGAGDLPATASPDAAEPSAVRADEGSAMEVTEGAEWLPPPPTGDVTLRGRVVDAAGVPLRGARILRVHTHADGSPVLLHGWIRFDLVGATDADGRFDATGQPSGRWLLQADFHGVRRVAGRLSLEGARALVLHGGEVREGLDFELPVDAARLGNVVVTLSGPDGRALPGETVAVGSRSSFADADGRVQLDGVTAGELVVRAAPAGMRPVAHRVRVEPGRTLTVPLRFEYVTSGTLGLEGLVVDDAGAPIRGASVYLGNDERESRAARTGDDGRFAFESLPDSMGREPVVLWVYGDFSGQRFGRVRRVIELPCDPLDVMVPRHVEVLVRLRSAGTGAPVPFHRIAVKRRIVTDGHEEWDVDRGASGHEPSGDVTVMVPAGRIRLVVETKGHEHLEVELDVPDTAAPFETTLLLTPKS